MRDGLRDCLALSARLMYESNIASSSMVGDLVGFAVDGCFVGLKVGLFVGDIDGYEVGSRVVGE